MPTVEQNLQHKNSVSERKHGQGFVFWVVFDSISTMPDKNDDDGDGGGGGDDDEEDDLDEDVDVTNYSPIRIRVLFFP